MTIEAQMSGADPSPCPDCPMERLGEYLASHGGQAISIVIDLDFALQSRLQVALNQIPYQEFCLLRLLADERRKFEVEEIEKQKPKHGR